MKTMKKIISIIIMAAMLFSLTACGKDNGDDKGAVKDGAKESDKEETGGDKGETANKDTSKRPKISILVSGDNTPKSDNLVIQELEKRDRKSVV